MIKDCLREGIYKISVIILSSVDCIILLKVRNNYAIVVTPILRSKLFFTLEVR